MSCELIRASAIDKFINYPNVKLIDLRSKDLYEKSHIKNAINVPYEKILEYFSFKRNENNYNSRSNPYYNSYMDLKKLLNDKNNIYIFYCERGTYSLLVCNKMANFGFDAKSMVGGYDSYKGINKVFH